MDRCALFVDAGYMLADGAMAVHGTRHREAVSWDFAGLLQLLSNLASERSGLPLLRCYWYDAAIDGRRTPDHESLADLPGLKLRLGRVRPGRRDGMDAEFHRDLSTLAHNHAIADAIIVSAEEDLAHVIADVQDLGVRVTLVRVAVEGNWPVSRLLRQECDALIEVDSAHLRPYVRLVAGAGSLHRDQRPVMRHAADPLPNGHVAASGHGGHHAAHAGLEVPDPLDVTAPGGNAARSQPGDLSAPDTATAPVVQQAEATVAPTASEPAAASEAPPVGAPPVGAQPVSAPPVVGAPSVDARPVGAPPVGAPPVGAPPVGAPPLGAPPSAAEQPAVRQQEAASEHGPAGQNSPSGQAALPAQQVTAGRSAAADQEPAVSHAPTTGQLTRHGLEARPSSAAAAPQVSAAVAPLRGTSQLTPASALPTRTPKRAGQPQPDAALPPDRAQQPDGEQQPGTVPQQGRASQPDVAVRPNGALRPAGGSYPAEVMLPGEVPQPDAALRPAGVPRPEEVPQPDEARQRVGAPAPQNMPTPQDQPVQAQLYGAPTPTPVLSAPPAVTASAASAVQGAPYVPSHGPFSEPQPATVPAASAPTATLSEATAAAHAEGVDFGDSVARDAPALWLEAVLARKPRMPSDLEARLLQGSSLPIDFLLHDEVRHALRRGFWDALEGARR